VGRFACWVGDRAAFSTYLLRLCTRLGNGYCLPSPLVLELRRGRRTFGSWVNLLPIQAKLPLAQIVPREKLSGWPRSAHGPCNRTLKRTICLMIRANSSLASTFGNTSLSDWLIGLACLVVGVTSASLIFWVRHRAKEVWTRLRRRERMLVRCVAIAALWCMLALLEHDRLEASWMTASVALLWGAYAVFSRTVDGIWSRMRRP